MSIACPVCGAWTSVKETRTKKNENIVTRRYECANLHRFSTEETVKCKSATSIAQPTGVTVDITVPGDIRTVWRK